MIGIFSGRGLSQDTVFAKIDVDFRKHLNVFNNGKNSNALAVFLCIALHADENGWAYPTRATIRKHTGIATEQAITQALVHLRSVTIEGHRIFEHYRTIDNSNKFGRSIYLIFPDLPHGDCPLGSVEVNPPSKKSEPLYDEPLSDDPLSDEQPSDGHTLNKNQLNKNQFKEKKTFEKFDDMVEESVNERQTPVLTEEEHKRRIASALQEGWSKMGSMKDRWRECFFTNPNWNNKTNSACLEKLMAADRLGQPIETFKEWWYKYDWRGRNKQPPTPAQALEFWPQAFTDSNKPSSNIFIDVN